MSAPKSVVKFKKDSIEYTSNVDACQYTICELTRAALRDVGKFVKRKFRENYYSKFQRKTGNAGKVTYCKVWSSPSTLKPRVEIGLPHASKGHKIDGFYGYFQETGTSKQPRLGLLRAAVEDNIAQIIEIESKYLSALEDEAQALKLIESEEDYEVEQDEN